jgi:Cupin domain
MVRAVAEELTFGGTTILVLTSADDPDGAIAVLEESQPMLDTPLHVHSKEDELIYVLAGQHIVTRGEEEFPVGPGDAIFLPREVPQAQRRVVPRRGPGADHLHPRWIRAVLPRPSSGRSRRQTRKHLSGDLEYRGLGAERKRLLGPGEREAISAKRSGIHRPTDERSTAARSGSCARKRSSSGTIRSCASS